MFYPDEVPGKKSPIEEKIVVGLETGMLLLHKHGNDCMLVSCDNSPSFFVCSKGRLNWLTSD